MKRPNSWNLTVLGAVLASVISAFGETATSPLKPIKRPGIIRIMPVGDSLTEGGAELEGYRPLLAEKLASAGYKVEFVGSKESTSRVGALRHEGYGGQTVEFLASTVPAHFRQYPADIVLLLAAANHFAEEQPVPGMIAAHERLIKSFREINPDVIVLLALSMEHGKLPKYSYIPGLNRELAHLARKLDSPSQRVIPVDLALGYDWRSDAISDKVHPNAQGAEKIAKCWFESLTAILGPP
jgi:lysophospholipase L1-like esterase